MCFGKKIRIMFCLLLLCLLCAWSEHGSCMTAQETKQCITIPIAEWNAWKNDWTMLGSELIACKSELQKIKKPSSELVAQLTQAEKMLSQLKTDLEKQNADLTTLSKQVDESKTELRTLKEKINKERRVHKRQIWQSRFWCLLLGIGVGCALK